MPKYTNEQVERAKNVDVRTFLEQTEGFDFARNGRYLKCKNPERTGQPSSLTIDTKMNRIFYNSVTGNRPLSALDWCKEVRQMDFQSSMQLVLGENPQGERVEKPKYKSYTPPPKTEDEKKDFVLPEKAADSRNVYAYLTATRGIPKHIVNSCIKSGLIMQDTHKNAVFVGYDDNNSPKYAARRGTFTPNGAEPFKRDVSGSDKNFAFKLVGKNTDTVYVTEAAIDALSLAAIEDKFNGEWAHRNKTYLSTGGAGIDSALEQFCKTHNVKTINICFDNDEAGKNGMEKIMKKYREKGYEVNDMRATLAHDYNDELLAFNKNTSFYSEPPITVKNIANIERNDTMPEITNSGKKQQNTTDILNEIAENTNALYEIDDIMKLSDKAKKEITEQYLKSGEVDEKLDRKIYTELNIMDFKEIIGADKLEEKGVWVSDIQINSSIGTDFWFGDKEMTRVDIADSFENCIREITFTNTDNETVSFNNYDSLVDAISDYGNTFFNRENYQEQNYDNAYVSDNEISAMSDNQPYIPSDEEIAAMNDSQPYIPSDEEIAAMNDYQPYIPSGDEISAMTDNKPYIPSNEEVDVLHDNQSNNLQEEQEQSAHAVEDEVEPVKKLTPLFERTKPTQQINVDTVEKDEINFTEKPIDSIDTKENMNYLLASLKDSQEKKRADLLDKIDRRDEKIAARQERIDKLNENIADLQSSLKSLSAAKLAFGNTIIGNLIDKSIEKKQNKIQEIEDNKIPKQQEKIKVQQNKKEKTLQQLGKVNKKIEKIDKVQNFISAISSKDRDVRHQGFVTGLENLSDIRRESLENKAQNIDKKIKRLTKEYNSSELSHKDRIKIGNEIKSLRVKSVEIADKIKSMSKLHQDLADIRDGRFTPDELDKTVEQTANKISAKLENSERTSGKGIVSHVVEQSVEAGSEAINEIVNKKEQAIEQAEKINPELEREHTPEEKTNVTKNEELDVLKKAAAITGLDISELNRLPAEIKADIVAEFNENQGISAEKLTERICDIANIDPPETLKQPESETIPKEKPQEKEKPFRELNETVNKTMPEKAKERDTANKDVPLFSRSKAMSDKFNPTSSKSKEDIERDKQKNKSNDISI